MAAGKSGAKYIGVSAQEFIDYASTDLESGDFREGTRLPKDVRSSYASFVAALRPQARKVKHYVFVWSRVIFIKIEF